MALELTFLSTPLMQFHGPQLLVGQEGVECQMFSFVSPNSSSGAGAVCAQENGSPGAERDKGGASRRKKGAPKTAKKQSRYPKRSTR